MPQRSGQLTVDGPVSGVAQLDNEIFVALESSRSISVFAFQGRQDFQRLDDVSFGELQTPPRDIAINEEFHHLFVADAGAQCVWQLDR